MSRPLSTRVDAISRHARGVWLSWAVVRVAGFVLMSGAVGYPTTDNDVIRYWGWAAALHSGHLPWSSFPVEYPPGILPFLTLPGAMFTYELQFIALAFVADAFVLIMLRRNASRGLGQWLWIAAPLALGTTFWLRLDLFVAAALVGFVVAVKARRWRTAGALLGFACLLKLWPLILLVVLAPLIPASGRRRLAGWCVGVIAAVTVPVVAWGGGAGLLAMLHFQGGRGLEVESVAAYPLMVAWHFGHHAPPQYSHYSMGFAVSGLLATGATWALPCAVVAITALVWRDNGRRITIDSGTLLVSIVVLMTSKVMSPQYLVWILALVAWRIDVSGWSKPSSPRRLAGLAVSIAALTQVLYPWWFGQLVTGGGTGILTVLSVRLALLLALTVMVFRDAFAPRSEPACAGEAAESAALTDSFLARLVRDEIHST